MYHYQVQMPAISTQWDIWDLGYSWCVWSSKLHSIYKGGNLLSISFIQAISPDRQMWQLNVESSAGRGRKGQSWKNHSWAWMLLGLPCPRGEGEKCLSDPPHHPSQLLEQEPLLQNEKDFIFPFSCPREGALWGNRLKQKQFLFGTGQFLIPCQFLQANSMPSWPAASTVPVMCLASLTWVLFSTAFPTLSNYSCNLSFFCCLDD